MSMPPAVRPDRDIREMLCSCGFAQPVEQPLQTLWCQWPFVAKKHMALGLWLTVRWPLTMDVVMKRLPGFLAERDLTLLLPLACTNI